MSKNLEDTLDAAKEVSELYGIKTICLSTDGSHFGVCHTCDTCEDFSNLADGIAAFLDSSYKQGSVTNNVAVALLYGATQFYEEHPEVLINLLKPKEE